jgi:hypothetical protein
MARPRSNRKPNAGNDRDKIARQEFLRVAESLHTEAACKQPWADVSQRLSLVWNDTIEVFRNGVPTRALASHEYALGRAILECLYSEQKKGEDIDRWLDHVQAEAIDADRDAEEHSANTDRSILARAEQAALDARADQASRELEAENSASLSPRRRAKSERQIEVTNLLRAYLSSLG